MAQSSTIGFGLGFIATVGILYCLGSRRWQINSQVSSQQVNRGIDSYQGLWVRCMSYIPGVYQCDNYDESYLALPASLQVQRAFMVIAGLLSVAGLAAGSLGLDCIQAVNGKPKIYAARIGGILMIFAGVLTLAAVSWYAAEVVQQFYVEQTNQASFAYQFGVAIFLGWIASGLELAAGAIMACCSCTEEYEEDYRYDYKPAKSQSGISRNAEYV